MPPPERACALSTLKITSCLRARATPSCTPSDSANSSNWIAFLRLSSVRLIRRSLLPASALVIVHRQAVGVGARMTARPAGHRGRAVDCAHGDGGGRDRHGRCGPLLIVEALGCHLVRLAAFARFLGRALGAIALRSGLGAGPRSPGAGAGAGRLGSRRGALDRRGRRDIQLRLLLRPGGLGRCGRLAWCSGAGFSATGFDSAPLASVSFFAFGIRHGQTSAGRRWLHREGDGRADGAGDRTVPTDA